MDRRTVLKSTFLAGAGLLALPLVAKAQAAPQALKVGAQISSNHGHSLELSVDDIVKLIRQANKAGVVQVDIKGTSSHPHAIEVDVSKLLALLTEGQIVLSSTVVGGHAHEVAISLS